MKMSCSLEAVLPSLPRTGRGRSTIISSDPKGKNILYVNGNSVIIRNVENPSNSDVYTEHAAQTTVAKYSPSGFYIASADVTGKIRIWDTTQKEHILKNEFQVFNGPILDLSWSFDNQELLLVAKEESDLVMYSWQKPERQSAKFLECRSH